MHIVLCRRNSGADFLWRVLLHVLPTGFRRVRDYGFLHGNAKRRLALVQLLLRVWIGNPLPRTRPPCVVPCAAHRWPLSGSRLDCGPIHKSWNAASSQAAGTVGPACAPATVCAGGVDVRWTALS